MAARNVLAERHGDALDIETSRPRAGSSASATATLSAAFDFQKPFHINK